jgi:hypothetical protein
MGCPWEPTHPTAPPGPTHCAEACCPPLWQVPGDSQGRGAKRERKGVSPSSLSPSHTRMAPPPQSTQLGASLSYSACVQEGQLKPVPYPARKGSILLMAPPFCLLSTLSESPRSREITCQPGHVLGPGRPPLIPWTVLSEKNVFASLEPWASPNTL